MDRCVNFRVCLLLLNHDKSTAYDEDSGSQTPLHLACAADHPEVARALLDHGAHFDRVNNDKKAFANLLNKQPLHEVIITSSASSSSSLIANVRGRFCRG